MPKHCVADTSFFNCKAKDLIIANLENIVAKYKGETKHWNLENKIEDTKLIIKQQKELEKKEEEINNYKNILKALEFYKSFTAQQSQFINFLSEMKHLETENEELKANTSSPELSNFLNNALIAQISGFNLAFGSVNFLFKSWPAKELR